MKKKKSILFTVGSQNQMTMMHQISNYLCQDYECFFSTLYGDGLIKWLTERGWLEMSILGKSTRKSNKEYYQSHQLREDYRGEKRNYDLVIGCQDLIVPKNLRKCKMIVVQEGTLVPMDWRSYLVKFLGLPRGLADTSLTGLSDAYDYFCVASEGYKKEFIKRGADPDKIMVTGIPNFDNVASYEKNDFPYKDYVLVTTSDMREAKRYEDRPALIRKVKQIANGHQIIFKLHPRENVKRATAEINRYAPGSLIFSEGNTNHMIANCDLMITRYSSVVLVAAAMGKKVICDYDQEALEELKPVQNGGRSAEIIANLGKELLEN